MPASENPSPIRRRRFGPTHLTVLLLAAMAIGAALWVFHSLRSLPAEVAEGGRGLARNLQRVAEAFQTGTVTVSFVSYATEVSGSSYLQFARLDQVELFERSEESTVFWGRLELPEVIVRATAPVEYTYYLDLDDRWDFRQEGRRIVVIAPEIRFNKPAVDASEIDYEVRAGSLLGDEAGALERLKGGITRMTFERARRNVPLVREIGRRKTEEFVANWIVNAFADGEGYEVEVIFDDEVERLEVEAPASDE